MNQNIKYFAALSSIVTFFVLIALYVGGSGNTHARGMDFSNYTSWVSFFFGMGVAIFISGYLVYIGTKGKEHEKRYIQGKMVKTKTVKSKGLAGIVIVILAIPFIVWSVMGFTTVLRAWIFNADTADIPITTANSGDFQMQSGSVEDYADKNMLLLLVTLEDRYEMVFRINCTSNFSADGQIYNDTTATLKGYNLRDEAVSGTYAPIEQPGDFTESSGVIIVVFEDVPQQVNNPQKAIAYFNLSLYDSNNGVIVASWIVITDPRLSEWELDTKP